MIYLIGSLRNEKIPALAQELREKTGHDVFDDWFSAGPEADDRWREHQQFKGLSFPEALKGPAARNVFEFDKRNIEASDIVVLALPGGRSAHLELGWAVGRGKQGYVLLDNPDRWDVMYQFATGVFDNKEALIESLRSVSVEA